MNNNLNNNKNNSYSGFKRETSSGFASGSFDIGDNSTTSRPMSYNDNYDYSSGSPMSYSDNNDYTSGSPMSYSDNDDYTSGSPMSYSDNNDYTSGAPLSYRDNNTFYSGSSLKNNIGIGGASSNPEPDFDPNASMYRPGPGEYDPNTSLYRPSSASRPASSSVSVVTLPENRNNNIRKIIIFSAIGLVLLIIIGIAVYNLFFAPMTVKKFLETDDGKREVLAYKSMQKLISEVSDADLYAEGDNTLVAEVTFNKTLTYKDQQSLDKVIELQKEIRKESIRNYMKEYNLKEFSYIYRYKDSSGSVIKEYKVSLDD